MKLTKERKFFTAVLTFYWLAILFATHIPVPFWVRKMGVSDKTMHFSAYLVLTILLWLSSSFGIKANWRKLRPWLLLLIILFYGIADEVTQHFIAGRSTDPLDLISDMLGAGTAMLAVTFTSGYNTAMILVVISPIFLPAIVRSQLVKEGTILEEVVYVSGFVLITIVWTMYLTFIRKMNLRQAKHLPLFFLCPAISVVILKFYAIFTNKPFEITDIAVILASIVLTLVAWGMCSKKSIT